MLLRLCPRRQFTPVLPGSARVIVRVWIVVFIQPGFVVEDALPRTDGAEALGVVRSQLPPLLLFDLDAALIQRILLADLLF